LKHSDSLRDYMVTAYNNNFFNIEASDISRSIAINLLVDNQEPTVLRNPVIQDCCMF